jgi:hypothetical protein
VSTRASRVRRLYGRYYRRLCCDRRVPTRDARPNSRSSAVDDIRFIHGRKGAVDVVNCPQCGTPFDRSEFEPDESYFECKDCEVALALTPAEHLAEARRHEGGAALDAKLYGESAPRLAKADGSYERPSLLPLRLWIGLLTLGAVIGTVVGVSAVVHGSYAQGAFSLAYSLCLVVPTVIGLVRRMRFALYTTYFIFGVNLLNVLLQTMQRAGSPPAKFGGTVLGALVFGGIAVLWLRWFVKNRDVFGPGMRAARLVDDIYSPGSRRDV